MQFQSEKLNRMTVFKAITALLVIITVLIVGSFAVVYLSRNAAYNSAIGAYAAWSGNVSSEIVNVAEAEGTDISSITAEQAQGMMNGSADCFNGVLIVSGSGHVLYDSEEVFGDYLPENVSLAENAVEVVGLGDKNYAVALSRVNDSLYVGGYMDFTASVQELSGLRTSVIAISAFSIFVIIAAFVFYAISIGLNERGHKYKYKLVTDSEGRIIKSNEAFKDDFPQTLKIYENVSHFSESTLNAIKLPDLEDEVFIACAAKKRANGNIKLSADVLAMPYNAQATQPREIMREVYVSFLPRGKAFLIGIINFTDLHGLKDMFGREFAEKIHGLLYEKISRHFTYIYKLDLYNIGIICPEGKQYENLLQDMRDIVNEFNQPLTIDNNIVNVTVKCGFAICDNSMAQRSFEYAMTATDAALRRALHEKIKNYYIFHGTEIKQYAKFFFNYDIRQMLEDNMFEMEYQPQFGIKENRIVGFEALFRVKKNANVFVDIFDLISYAERSGYMVVLGDFIFDTAMSFAKRVEDKNVTVSLNVSPVQLMQAGFCENFLEIYDRYNIKPGVICVEITESFLVQNFDDAVKKLEILREHGIEIHLDDFGTRYSSLLYLKKLPVQVIKIDREFVIDVNDDEFDRSITEMIVNICKKHNLLCIAEGVETMEQFKALENMGVDVIQGFLIGKSAPADTAERLIDEFVLK